MSVRLWVFLGLLAFLGGSLLRLGVETGRAFFTMFGMIAFLLIGLLALQEAAGHQTRRGRSRLERALQVEARGRPVLRLPPAGGGGPRYLVRAGTTWLALGFEASSEAGFWPLVRPVLAARARRLRERAAALPLGEQDPDPVPVLVLLRRKVRQRETVLGRRLGVRLVNVEGLPALLRELEATPRGGEPAADAAGRAGDADPAGSLAGLARRLGAESLQELRPAVMDASGPGAYPLR